MIVNFVLFFQSMHELNASVEASGPPTVGLYIILLLLCVDRHCAYNPAPTSI